MQPWKLWKRGDIIKEISGLEPRLASWDKHTHPSQVRLRAYLDQVITAIMPLPEATYPFFLHLDISVENPDHLLHHHDLENYLTPLFGQRYLNSSKFALVSAHKQIGKSSHLFVGMAQPQNTDMQDWVHFSYEADNVSKWKDNLRATLADAKLARLPDGPVEVQLAWQCSPERNWVSLWKSTGDAMEPVLGAPNPANLYNPNDDRIVELSLHRNLISDAKHHLAVGMWWRSVNM